MNHYYLVFVDGIHVRNMTVSTMLVPGMHLDIEYEDEGHTREHIRGVVAAVTLCLNNGGTFLRLDVQTLDSLLLMDRLAAALVESERVRVLGMQPDVHFESLREDRRASVDQIASVLADYEARKPKG